MPYKEIEKQRQWHRDRRNDIRNLIRSAKNKPCMDCKNSYPICAMQFDHVRNQKKMTLAAATGNIKSLEFIKTEIKKCDVVCANCHLIREEKRKLERNTRFKKFGSVGHCQALSP